jgi:hypothetical protein
MLYKTFYFNTLLNMDRIRIRIQNKSFRIPNNGSGFEICACTVLYSRTVYFSSFEMKRLLYALRKKICYRYLTTKCSVTPTPYSLIILRSEPRKQELRTYLT